MFTDKFITKENIKILTRIFVKGVEIAAGEGSPEGVLAAPIGSIYLNKTAEGGQLWEKRTGTGTSGWSKLSGFTLDPNGNIVIDNTKKVGNGVANSSNSIQFGNGATIYNVPTGQQHIFRQNGSTVAGIDGNGKIYVEGAGKGIILKSPDGTRYEITVPDGGGSLTVTAL